MKKILTAVIGVAFTLILSCGITANAEEYKLTLLQEGGFPHPYYSENEPDALRGEIENALFGKEPNIEISAPELSAEELTKVYEDVINHAPGLYYVLGNVNIEKSETGYTIYPSYKELIEIASSSVQQAVDDILAQVKPSMCDAEKILAVHDYMVLNYEYDLNYEIYSADAFFSNKRGVCQAYTLAFGEIMDRLGITWEYVTSDLMNHAWNMVRLDGEWYHVDVTWDDPVSDKYGFARHEYLLLSDDAISDDVHRHHDWETGGYWGFQSGLRATSTKYDNYFWTQIDEPIQYYNGNWYWCSYWGAGDISPGIGKYNFSTGKAEPLIDVYASKMNVYNGYIYFLYSGIVYISPLSKPTEAVPATEFQVPDKCNGIHMENGRLYYAIAEDEYYMRVGNTFDDSALYHNYYDYRKIHSIDLRGYKYNSIAPSWRFDEENGMLIVSANSGVIPDYGDFDPPWKSYSDVIKKIYIGSNVKQIEANAFQNMRNAVDIILPDKLEKIGERAFSGCSSIKILNVPDSVTSIDCDAFYNCRSLSLLFMGNGIKDIGESAFDSCRNLAEVYYSGSEQDLATVSIGDWNTNLTNAQITCDYVSPMLLHVFDYDDDTVVLWLNNNRTLAGENFDCRIKQYSYGRVYDYGNAECVYDSNIVGFNNGVFSGLTAGQTPVTIRVGEDEVSFNFYVGTERNFKMFAYFGYGVTPIAASYGENGELLECHILTPEEINSSGINYVDYGGETKFMAWGDMNNRMYPAGDTISLSDAAMMSLEGNEESVLQYVGAEECGLGVENRDSGI